MNKEFTKEEALKLHRKMWGDMQRELGDCPNVNERIKFKQEWMTKNGFGKNYQIKNNCFLCEYATYNTIYNFTIRFAECKNCPINWKNLTPNEFDVHYGTCMYSKFSPKEGFWGELWQVAPISEILNLPEKENK